jgi:hypothetical protein
MSRKIKRYGWILDLPDQRDHLYAAPQPVLAKLPEKITLRLNRPRIFNQGELGSCTANAIAAAQYLHANRENDANSRVYRGYSAFSPGEGSNVRLWNDFTFLRVLYCFQSRGGG